MNLRIGSLLSLVLMGSVHASNAEKTPWDDQDSPQVAYSQFLTYAGKNVRDLVEYNEITSHSLSKMYSQKKVTEKELDPESADVNPLDSLKVVAAHSGAFYPLNTWNGNTYCSRLVVQNLNFKSIVFCFEEDIIPRVLGMGQVSKTIGQEARVAYRNIVPSLFGESSSLAGPMGLNEFLVDGHRLDFTKDTIIFFANKNREVTPLEVYFKNCTGLVGVKGIDSDNKIFHSSDSPDLNFLYTDENERENGFDGSE